MMRMESLPCASRGATLEGPCGYPGVSPKGPYGPTPAAPVAFTERLMFPMDGFPAHFPFVTRPVTHQASALLMFRTCDDTPDKSAENSHRPHCVPEQVSLFRSGPTRAAVARQSGLGGIAPRQRRFSAVGRCEFPGRDRRWRAAATVQPGRPVAAATVCHFP